LWARLSGWKECVYDRDGDGDVDGFDLAGIASDLSDVALDDVAIEYGKLGCVDR